MILKLLLFLFLFVPPLHATITISDDTKKIDLLQNSSIYLDTSSQKTFKQIQNKTFTPIKSEQIHLGYTSDTLWVKFSIKNVSHKALKPYLTLSNPILDTIELYIKKGDQYTKTIKGLMHLDQYDRNNILHPSFQVAFTPHELKVFYLKIHSISSANYFELQLTDSQTLYQNEFSYQLIESLLFGAMIGLIIYNLFLFFFIREIVYLYYVLYMFFITINHASYSLMLDYVIGEEYIHIETFFALYYIGLANIFALLFIKTFLQITHKTHTRIINFLMLLSFILMLSQTSIEYMTNLGIIILFFTLYLCIDALYRQNSQVKYILTGWIINIIGVFSLGFKEHGLWTPMDYIPYFYEMTLLAEAVLFSAALASRLNKTKALERSLKTNTILIKELHHRVKNNMQFIILMYRLKLENIMSTQLNQGLREAEGTIQAISKTYEILYQQEDLKTIDTKEYFHSLTEELKRSFDTSNISIYLDATAQLTMHQSIQCGIILNELMTNTFKYAFPENKGKIHISLKQEKDAILFLFKDNGIGFNGTAHLKESFGLSFIEALVKDELHGSMDITSSDGVTVLMKF